MQCKDTKSLHSILVKSFNCLCELSNILPKSYKYALIFVILDELNRQGMHCRKQILTGGTILLLSLAVASCGKSTLPQPYGAIPTPAQVEWQKMETNMFCHFGPNTFTGVEWGEGTEPEDIFNPTDLDCDQWARVAKASGLKGIIITAKHHDGFCLWPNPMSEHTVAASSWKGGKGDVLAELSKACSDNDVKMGVYISPWDRNAPTYGTPEYNEVFRKTIEHVHSNYGDIFEQWFDGANGEGPNGKRQVYDWPAFNSEVYKHHPSAVIFSDVGPGCRWIGNESARAGKTDWSTLNVEGFEPGLLAPPTDTLNVGNVHGSKWVPSEADVSIRPGWFYKDSESAKSLKELLSIYYTSVGRNAVLLLNVPPDTRGHIAEADSIRLVEWREALDEIFSKVLTEGSKVKVSSKRGTKFSSSNLLSEDYDKVWVPSDKDMAPSVEIDFPGEVTLNRIMLQEYIPLGQRVSSFHVEALLSDGSWKNIAAETTIGYKRIVLTENVSTTAMRVVFDDFYAVPVISRIAVFNDTVSGI